DELGGLGSDGLGSVRPEQVDVDLSVLERVPERSAERGRLQIGQEGSDAVCAQRPGRDPQRAVVSGHGRCGGDQLSAIALKLLDAWGDGRRAEVDEADLAPD